MSIWYQLCDLIPLELLQWEFMKNAFLAIFLMAPLFGILSTMIVTGRMSFFSDALGHSAFTGIAIGSLCGMAAPLWAAVIFSVVFALLFSYVRNRSNQAADTLIGVFSSTAVALGIFITTLGGGSFTKYNKYLIGDILSITPGEIASLALVLAGVLIASAIMCGVFALLGKFDLSVVLGALAGTVLATGNFFFMAVSATLAADKAEADNVERGKAMMQTSYFVRLLVLAIALFVCAKSGVFHLIALVLPMIFVRPVLSLTEFFRKAGEPKA
jgi:ABC-type Mn2+/Zn2+ transport system permease subunit